MKILLINPTNSVPLKSDFVVNIYQPMGIAYIAAMLEKNNYQVKILDALAMGFDRQTIVGNKKVFGLSYQQIKARIKKYHPDIVGVTTPFSFQAEEAHKMFSLVKEVDSKIKTIVGGPHATIQPEDMLSDPNVDFLIAGEGEYAMLEFVNAVKHHQSLKKFKNYHASIITNLNDLPLPARHLLPMKQYFKAAKMGRVVEGLLEYGKKRTNLFTSRGCPFNCTFCSVHLTMSHVWRCCSPENVIAEIKYCYQKYGITYFDILDDNFTLDPNRAKKICQLIIESKLPIKWSTPNGIRADTVDEELIILMKKAGCIQIKVAPESGSSRVLKKIIRKNLDLNKVKKVVKLSAAHHLSVEAFFVIGFPEEKEADILKTIKYAKELRALGCDYCYFFLATPYYGTEMFENAVAKGYIDPDSYRLNEIYTTGNTIIKSPNFTSQRLKELQKLAHRVNPPVTYSRFIAGLKILILDPSRIIRFALVYLKYFLP
jgi:anaerobic magnesium-protoporphyrin IX monomethyl ester cyclase